MNVSKAGLFFFALINELIIGAVCAHFQIGTVSGGLNSSIETPGAFSSWTYIMHAATFTLGSGLGAIVSAIMWLLTVMVIWAGFELVASFVP